MWSNLLLDVSSQYNYNFGFSTHKSDVLLHLAQWQYWWWFWFALLWVFYFYIIYFVVTTRTAEFNPVLNSSLRSHGKWGDFLVCLIPLSWCGNILLNSNFILRMLEWQAEGSLFVVRVQGKQWYWVYKFDNTLYSSLVFAPRNIGDNNWVVTSQAGSISFDSYYQAAHIAAQTEFNSRQLASLKSLGYRSIDQANTTQGTGLKPQLFSPYNINNNSSQHFRQLDVSLPASNIKFYKSNKLRSSLSHMFSLRSYEVSVRNRAKLSSMSIITSDKTHPLNIELGDVLRYAVRSQPLRIIKNIVVNTQPTLELVTAKFTATQSAVTEKSQQLETYWGFRQKKYARRDSQKFLFKPLITYSPTTLQSVGVQSSEHKYKYIYNYSNSSELLNFKNVQNSYIKNPVNYYNSIRINRLRSDTIPTTLSKRLLRVRRTLVLPAHVNITVITNSYDVVHSWFIPGLGIKLDCVPGRSTHHTFYIDNVGFYYGQCAEICGRYHHHMPIRVCALPYEHFVVWWQTRGLARMRRLSADKTLINYNKIQL